MKKQICSLTSQEGNRQAFFLKWIDQEVRRLVVGLAEKLLELQMQTYLQAGWNQRTATRLGHRNGYYSRQLSTPHGPLCIRVPRRRQGGIRLWSLIATSVVSRMWSESCGMRICWVPVHGVWCSWPSRSSVALSVIKPSAD